VSIRDDNSGTARNEGSWSEFADIVNEYLRLGGDIATAFLFSVFHLVGFTICVALWLACLGVLLFTFVSGIVISIWRGAAGFVSGSSS
jgi:hypothetical protein